MSASLGIPWKQTGFAQACHIIKNIGGAMLTLSKSPIIFLLLYPIGHFRQVRKIANTFLLWHPCYPSITFAHGDTIDRAFE